MGGSAVMDALEIERRRCKIRPVEIEASLI